MDSLTDVYNSLLVPRDEQLAKEASELQKVAEEEDAAGRIMARGFLSELDKLAACAKPRHGTGEGGSENTGAPEKKCPGCGKPMSECKCPK